MELSLPAWIGAWCGMIVAAAIYGPLIRLFERQLRGLREAKTTPEQRLAFEDRFSVVRRLILACGVAVLAAAGYWIGNMFGGGFFGAPGS